MRVAVCDDNLQDIEKIKRYTIRMIEYAVDYGVELIRKRVEDHLMGKHMMVIRYS